MNCNFSTLFLIFSYRPSRLICYFSCYLFVSPNFLHSILYPIKYLQFLHIFFVVGNDVRTSGNNVVNKYKFKNFIIIYNYLNFFILKLTENHYITAAPRRACPGCGAAGVWSLRKTLGYFLIIYLEFFEALIYFH